MLTLPALSQACLGAPILMAAIRGDLSSMFSYADHPEEEEEEGEEKEAEEKKKD